ncbi:kinase-like domain-containing protein [Phyllosticta citrichinensis]|uniref:Kinase-like domain-containing protein n=1 Tax=Phyllosticta citrichinensis TaxID=1130410 RepID=A0ABR1Y5I1_9PEZI
MDFDENTETNHTVRTIKWIEQCRAREADLPNWMASFRPGHSCSRLNRLPLAGSFNFYFIFEFDDGVKWLARFPIPGRTMDPDGKLRREVAVIKHIQANTSIPVPAIHFWGMSADNNLGLGPFMIMDYVDGLKLGELWKDPTASRLSRHLKKDISDRDLRIVHRQMARFLLELYKLRFDKIGSLVMDDDGQMSVQGPPLTWTMQEIEAHSGIKAGGDRLEPFESSTEYFDWITDMDWQHLEEQFNSVVTLPTRVPKYDSAPFGLVCDDFRYGNMLINNEQDLHIMAVLDWEWSYTAPLQLCHSPPRALWGKLPNDLSLSERRGELARYKEFLDTFMDELRREEEAQMDDSHGSNSSSSVDAQPKLSVLMQKSWDDGTLWFNEIILSCYMGGNDTAWKLLCKQYPEIAVADDIDEEALAEFVERKVRWREQYDEIERTYAANSAAKKEKEAQEERDKADSQKGDGQGDGAEGQTGDDGYLAGLAALQKPVPLSGDPALHIAAVAWYEVPSGAPPTQL